MCQPIVRLFYCKMILRLNVLFSVTEEDFVMLFSKKVGDEESTEDQSDTQTKPKTNQSQQKVIEDDGSPAITNIRHLVKVGVNFKLGIIFILEQLINFYHHTLHIT